MSFFSFAGSIAASALFVGASISAPPDACKLITLADVTAALGRGFARNPAAAPSDRAASSCAYLRAPATTVAISMLPGPNHSGKAAVLEERQRYETLGRSVAPLAGLCDAAFSVIVAPSDAFVVAAKGRWELDIQVLVSGRPNLNAAQALTKAACGHRP